MPAVVGRRYASIKQTAEYLGIGERTVRDKIAAGLLVAYRNGGIIRLDLNEVDAAMVSVGGDA